MALKIELMAAENSVCPHRNIYIYIYIIIIIIFYIYPNRKQLFYTLILLQFFYCIFDQINAALPLK